MRERLSMPGGRLRLVLLALFLLVLLVPHGARTARCNDQWNLHPGSCGQRVADLQWLLAGHKPNVFTKVKPTFKFDANGAYGARTKAAVRAYKYRIGYPTPISDAVGPYFLALLKGTAVRPAVWVANAAHRVKAVVPGATEAALKVKALEVSWLGIVEQPLGSNRGPRISYSVGGHAALQSSTGAYGLAWCVSTQQEAFKEIGYGTFADRTAGVFYAVSWAQRRNYLNAKPKVGAIVAFMDGQGHMGYVTKVTASGFVSIEGNASNRVLERFHTLGDRRPVFIYLPGVA